MIRSAVSAIAIAAFAAMAGCADGEDHHAAAAGHDSHSETSAQEQTGDLSAHGSHEYSAPELASLGGEFTLIEATKGASFTDKDLLGKWSIVYMGYMECQEACPIALAAMPGAVRKLNENGLAVTSVFVDINAPRLDDDLGGMHRRHADHDAPAQPVLAESMPTAEPEAAMPMEHSGHDSADKAGNVTGGGLTGPEIRRIALAEWGKRVDEDMVVLSGSRKQVLNALRLFKTRAEPNMNRNAEPGHRINHTTNIYVVGPDGKVAGLLYHDTPMDEMVSTVTELERQSKI